MLRATADQHEWLEPDTAEEGGVDVDSEWGQVSLLPNCHAYPCFETSMPLPPRLLEHRLQLRKHVKSEREQRRQRATLYKAICRAF